MTDSRAVRAVPPRGPVDPEIVVEADLAVWLGPELARRWQQVRMVGGTSSRVVLAHDAHLDRDVAVKVLLGAGGAVRSGDAPPEARAQAALSHHPHVVTLHEAGVTPSGFAYLVLEWAPGGTLAEARHVPTARLLSRGAEVAGALAACHELGYVHGDVKPSNVLLAADGTARLADFGIAGRTDDALGTLDDLRGSLHYAAPELLDGVRPAAAGDVYALAVTLWTVAAGRVPFGGAAAHPSAVMARIQAAGLTFGATPLAAAGPGVVALLDAAAASDPRDRPSALQLAEVLGRAARDLAGGTAPPPTHRTRRGPLVALAVGGLAVASALVAAPHRSDPVRPAASYCAVYRQSVLDRDRLLEDVAAELEVATDPAAVVHHLLDTYPERFARITRPWLVRTAALADDASLALSTGELEELALADAMRSLTGGKATVRDGADGAIPVEELPGDLRRPATIVSEAGRIAAPRCPEVHADLRAAKARMSSSIVSNLTDPAFMARFFENPRSLEVITARQVSLMATVAGPFFGSLLAEHWDFVLRLCDLRPEVRAEIAFDHPELILAAVRARPDLVDLARDPGWQADLRRGLDRLAASSRWGIEVVYHPQLVGLGLAPA